MKNSHFEIPKRCNIYKVERGAQENEKYFLVLHRRVAQLVARLVHAQKVIGSNPISAIRVAQVANCEFKALLRRPYFNNYHRSDNMGYIYKITNKINSKSYIGKTESTIEKRF